MIRSEKIAPPEDVGEQSSDHPRLGWWSADMVSEYGGLDFFTPRTAQWAALEVACEAARRTDGVRQAATPTRTGSARCSALALGSMSNSRLASLTTSAAPRLGRRTSPRAGD